jgi:PII-like signaling protein
MQAKRLVILVGEADQWHHRPLYLAILEVLKAAGCAGATALSGTGRSCARRSSRFGRPRRCVPVVDRQGRAIGMVSRPSLLAAALDLIDSPGPAQASPSSER